MKQDDRNHAVFLFMSMEMNKGGSFAVLWIDINEGTIDSRSLNRFQTLGSREIRIG